MEFHLDYSLEASSEIDNSLYDWCIREVDKNGKQVGETKFRGNGACISEYQN